MLGRLFLLSFYPIPHLSLTNVEYIENEHIVTSFMQLLEGAAGTLNSSRSHTTNG